MKGMFLHWFTTQCQVHAEIDVRSGKCGPTLSTYEDAMDIGATLSMATLSWWFMENYLRVHEK